MNIHPLYEILFFIALFFAPEETTEFKIAGAQDNPIVFQLVDDNWQNATEGKIWRLEDTTVSHVSSSHDVKSNVEGISEHSWSDESILHL